MLSLTRLLARRRWLALLALLPALSPGGAAAAPLPRYEIQLKVDPITGRVEALQRLWYVNTTLSTLDQIVFTVVPARYNAFRLDVVRRDGEEAPWSLEDSILEVALTPSLGPGAPTRIDLEYQVQVPLRGGRFGQREGVLALGNLFPVIQIYRTPRLAVAGQPLGWARTPYTEIGDAFFSEVADFTVDLELTRPAVVASGANLVQQEELRYRFAALGVRDFGLAISPSYQTQSREVDGVTLAAYYLPEHAAQARTYLDVGAEALRWMSQTYGQYPLDRLALAEVSSAGSTFVGQEYPGLIMLGSGLTAGGGGVAGYLGNIVAHEVAHQWFYGLVGNDQVYEPWLDEALATWLSHEFLRSNYPELYPSAWSNLVALNRRERSLLGERPVDGGVYDFSDEGPYFAFVYRKGAQLIEALRERLGPAVLTDALGEYVRLYGGQVATAADLADVLRQRSDGASDEVLAAYLARPPAPGPARPEPEPPPADVAPVAGGVPASAGAEAAAAANNEQQSRPAQRDEGTDGKADGAGSAILSSLPVVRGIPPEVAWAYDPRPGRGWRALSVAAAGFGSLLLAAGLAMRWLLPLALRKPFRLEDWTSLPESEL